MSKCVDYVSSESVPNEHLEIKPMFQFTTLLSLTVLCLIGWIEMFSNRILLPNLPPINEFVVPIVILYVSFPINEIMHRMNVQEDDPYSRAHGTLSAVFPARCNINNVELLTDDETWSANDNY